jgi:hypothetical protein
MKKAELTFPDIQGAVAFNIKVRPSAFMESILAKVQRENFLGVDAPI